MPSGRSHFVAKVGPKSPQGAPKVAKRSPKGHFWEPGASLFWGMAAKPDPCENISIYYGLATLEGSWRLPFRTQNRLENATCTRCVLFRPFMSTLGAKVTPKAGPRDPKGPKRSPRAPPGTPKKHAKVGFRFFTRSDSRRVPMGGPPRDEKDAKIDEKMLVLMPKVPTTTSMWSCFLNMFRETIGDTVLKNEPNKAKKRKTMSSNAKQSKAMRSKAKESKAPAKQN